MSTPANTSVDYEDEVFDSFDDATVPFKPSVSLGAPLVPRVTGISDDDLISAAHLAKTASGNAANAGSDEDLEPVHIQLTVTIPGSNPAVLKFDDSISYDEFKKRLAAIGCDKVTYKNMAGVDVSISNDKNLDVFIDMMVDDFEGENKLQGKCVAAGSSILSAAAEVRTTDPVLAKNADHDSKALAHNPEISVADNSKVVAVHIQASIAGPDNRPDPVDAVAVSAAEGIQAFGEFKPVGSLEAYSLSHNSIISSVRDGVMKTAWQHLPELRHELAVLDSQRSGVASATQVCEVLARVLKLQPSNAGLQALVSVFGGDSGSINIERLLHSFVILSPTAVRALESVRNIQLQNASSLSGFRIFNCHTMACGYDSTELRCAVLELCLQNGKESTAPAVPVSVLLSKYSSTTHKIDLASLVNTCAVVGAVTDTSSMSVSAFNVTRNLALATELEVALITQCLAEQSGRHAVMSVVDVLLPSLRATLHIERRKSINPFASSKPIPKAKTEKAVVDALNSGCAGSAQALSYMLACPAADNASMIAFIESLHWVESSGVLSDVACSSLGKSLQPIMNACIAEDTEKSGVIPLSAFAAILAQHPCDASVNEYCSAVARDGLIDYRHLLMQRILVMTAQESAALSSWNSAPQQILRTFLISHSHILNSQFVAAATKLNCVPRRVIKSCIAKLPSIGSRSTDQLVTQLIDGCTANSTSDPDVFFLDSMTATSVRLLQLSALHDSIFSSRSAICAAAVASGSAEASFLLNKACKIVSSSIPAHHSYHDVSSFLCQFCNETGSILLYRAVQSLVRLPADAYDELVATFHGPYSSAIQHLCTLISLHHNGSPASADKIIEDISAAPGLPFIKSVYKAAPSFTFGHGALSKLMTRISKVGLQQVSVKGFLQPFVPAVAALIPAILLPKITQVGSQRLSEASPALPSGPAVSQGSPRAPTSAVASGPLVKAPQSVSAASSSADTNPGLARARALFRKLIRARRPSSIDVLRMLGVSTSLFPSALSVHEASGKCSFVNLLKTTSNSLAPLQLSGMWPTLTSIVPCSVFDLRIIDAKCVPSAGAMFASVHRKVRVTFCNGIDSFVGSLATVTAKTHRGDDHTWDFPSAQVLSVAVSQAAIDAHPNGGLFIELSIIVAKKNADSQAAPVVARAAGRDMSAGWALIPWAELKAGTKTLNLAGGLPWSQLKIQPEDCGSRKGFFGLSKMQAPVSSITVKLDHAGEAAHFPDKCVCPKNAVPLLQLYALFLRSQISSLLGQSSAVRNPTFHNLLLSAFPQLINEAPLRNALIAQFSQLGGNVKANLVAFADPQNRDVVNQIKFLHRAVSLLQPLLHVNGLTWGVAALHEDDYAAAKKERIVKAFAADPIAFLSGKSSSIELGSEETLKFEPTRSKELCFTIPIQ